MKKVEEMRSATWGKFWIANTNEEFAGELTLTSRWQRLKIFGALMPEMQIKSTSPDGVTTSTLTNIGGEDLTIHGRVMGGGTPVTLVNTNCIRRNQNLFTNGELSTQEYESSYALVGDHVDGPEAKFNRVRFRVQNINSWCRLPGLSRTSNAQEKKFGFHYEMPEAYSVDLLSGSGSISIEPEVSIPSAGYSGASIKTRAWVVIHLNEPQTLEEIRENYVWPTCNLLTVMYNRKCPPLFMEVKGEGSERWSEVAFYGQEPEEEEIQGQPLMTLDKLGMEGLAGLIRSSDALFPLPSIVADAIRQKGHAIESQLLELASTIEGLHRRLYPSDRNLSEEEVSAGLSKLASSDIPDRVNSVLSTALKTYLWDASFPQRIERIAQDTEHAAPNATGKTNKWKRSVTNARNGFAHSIGLGEKSTLDELHAHIVLVESLKWVITARILLHSGATEEEIARSFTGNRYYEQFLKNAQHYLPGVYGQP